MAKLDSRRRRTLHANGVTYTVRQSLPRPRCVDAWSLSNGDKALRNHPPERLFAAADKEIVPFARIQKLLYVLCHTQPADSM